MTARPALVSQQEIKRTVAGVLAGGMRPGRVEVDHRTGTVTVYPEGFDDTKTQNPCDRLLK
jgi:hypothetical protein